MREHINILRCPRTGDALELRQGELISAGGQAYPIRDGIANLLPADGFFNDAVREFYDEFGWKRDVDGEFAETKAFSDRRTQSMAFTRRCIERLGRYFARGGNYFLDAGCGPIAYDELIPYDAAFQHRVCLDLSANGLRYAKEKIGRKGVYLQADITNIPLASNSMDAILCNHVIYQLQGDDLQRRAFLELWRVLKPGGVAVICYWWKDAPLPGQIARVTRRLGMSGPGLDGGGARPELVHEPRTRAWFEGQHWPFDYRYDIYRIVSNGFMVGHLPSDWRGDALLALISGAQWLAPSYCGRHGVMPAIILRKPIGETDEVSAASRVANNNAEFISGQEAQRGSL